MLVNYIDTFTTQYRHCSSSWAAWSWSRVCRSRQCSGSC